MMESGKAIDKDLHDMARHETQLDKMFTNFKKRIANDPEQVLRYQRNGKYIIHSIKQNRIGIQSSRYLKMESISANCVLYLGAHLSGIPRFVVHGLHVGKSLNYEINLVHNLSPRCNAIADSATSLAIAGAKAL